LGVTPAEKWREFVEEEKTLYAIVPVEFEENTIYKLELIKTYYPIYPYTNHVSTLYVLEWDGADRIELSKKVIRDSWYGTGTEHIATLTLEMVTPETPWFFDLLELEKTVDEFGVKETQKLVLNALKEDVVYGVFGDDDESE